MNDQAHVVKSVKVTKGKLSEGESGTTTVALQLNTPNGELNVLLREPDARTLHQQLTEVLGYTVGNG
jgi:hypothetical protein